MTTYEKVIKEAAAKLKEARRIRVHAVTLKKAILPHLGKNYNRLSDGNKASIFDAILGEEGMMRPFNPPEVGPLNCLQVEQLDAQTEELEGVCHAIDTFDSVAEELADISDKIKVMAARRDALLNVCGRHLPFSVRNIIR